MQPSPPPGAEPAAPATPVKVKRVTFDWTHTAIVLAFTFGVLQSGAPILLAAVHPGQTVNMTGLFAFVTLAGAAVAAFFKHPPGSFVEAIEEGEQVGQQPPPGGTP